MQNLNSSPFNHVLHSNYTPSCKEIKTIKNLILEPEERVRLLKEEIVQLQGFIDSHRALLAPARRLPRDIIVEIFLHCLPTDRLPARSVKEAPLLLTTICRQWRDVALDTPRLWRAIHFAFPRIIGYTLDDTFRNMFRAWKEGLQRWLGRARSVPVTISYVMRPRIDKYVPQIFRQELEGMCLQLMDILTHYRLQWKSLYLQHLPIGTLSSFRNIKGSDAPLLDTLFLHYDDRDLRDILDEWPVRQASDYPFLDIARLPSIRALHIGNDFIDPFLLPICWNKLIELQMRITEYFDTINAYDVMYTLSRRCRSLRKCQLGLFAAYFPDAYHRPAQKWDTLTELDLSLPYLHPESISSMCWKTFFNLFTAPNLSRLTIHVRHGGRAAPFQIEEAPFLGLLTRSNCRITHLDLDMRLSDKALIECLQWMPSLTSLHASHVVRQNAFMTDYGELWTIQQHLPLFTHYFFESLIPSEDNVLCPRLETLSLKYCGLDRAEDICRLAQARSGQDQTVRLRSISVTVQTDTSEGPTTEQLEGAQLLKDAGAEVIWYSNTFDEKSYIDYSAKRDPLLNPFVNTTPTAGMPDLLGEY
ncbi:hypothetical protein VNI00_013811 [Paramarasmius palmivorus]|uniref:F-box domain-containing protein n=1 Tax=Paramarasmius palmivorus TaxID=297713 RepID=A0AAW0BW23_9AGAR